MKASKNLKLTCGGIELHEGWLQHGHDSVHLAMIRIMMIMIMTMMMITKDVM